MKQRTLGPYLTTSFHVPYVPPYHEFFGMSPWHMNAVGSNITQKVILGVMCHVPCIYAYTYLYMMTSIRVILMSHSFLWYILSFGTYAHARN